MIRQKENRAWDLWTEANLNPWQTESQWLPRGDYYRFGDSLLGNRFTYFQHSGADFANTHPAVEVNNPYTCSRSCPTTRSATRARPSVRAGSTRIMKSTCRSSSISSDSSPTSRARRSAGPTRSAAHPWDASGAAVGARASIMASRPYPTVESELFNVHGLYHKLNFDVDARDAWSNVKLDTIGVQDDLDDNTYEYVRRYLALTDYAGGLLPPQYDPRHLILRRMMSPISGPTDIQASLESIQMSLHQRLQTKRGPTGSGA